MHAEAHRLRLRGCIIDWVYADNEDRADIVDNTQEQCPGLALTETCAEFTCNGTGLIPDPAKQAGTSGGLLLFQLSFGLLPLQPL